MIGFFTWGLAPDRIPKAKFKYSKLANHRDLCESADAYPELPRNLIYKLCHEGMSWFAYDERGNVFQCMTIGEAIYTTSVRNYPFAIWDGNGVYGRNPDHENSLAGKVCEDRLVLDYVQKGSKATGPLWMILREMVIRIIGHEGRLL